MADLALLLGGCTDHVVKVESVSLCALLRKDFNPDQPRDEQGRWGAGAYSSERGTHSDKFDRLMKATPLSHVESDKLKNEFVNKVNALKGKNERGNVIMAMKAHQGSTHIGDETRKYLDVGYKKCSVELTRDTVLYRGMRVEQKLFERMRNAVVQTKPVAIRQDPKRYVPSTVATSVAQNFAQPYSGKVGVILEVVARSGARVMPMYAITGSHPSEREFALDRGSDFRVVSYQKPGTHSDPNFKNAHVFRMELVVSAHQGRDTLGGHVTRTPKEPKFFEQLPSGMAGPPKPIKVEIDRVEHFMDGVVSITIEDEELLGTDLSRLLKGSVDSAAYRAATYPFNLRRQPTEGEKTAGNYPKGHLSISGLNIAIENPAYSKRRPEWPELKAHYGYVKRTEGADGDQVDVFVKPGTHDDWNGTVFVINQHVNGAFDEHKVMIGWPDLLSAKQGYLDNYTEGWQGIGSVAALSIDEFKAWLKHEDTTKPHPAAKVSLARLRKDFDESQHPRDERGRFGEGSGEGMSQKDGQWQQGGQPVAPEVAARLTELRVPPAWTGVQLNPDVKGALQAVGKDSKGRTQYLYSAAHSEAAAAEKFGRLKEFNEKAPEIMSTAQRDMMNPKLNDSQRDAAAVVSLIAATGFRIGSETDTGAKVQAYGATTLQGQHVKVEGDKLTFSFTGKKGVAIEHEVTDARLAAYIGGKQAGEGQHLFSTSDAAVRDYFHQVAGEDFKVKDFRTWNGTSLALREISSRPVPATPKEYSKAQREVAKVVAAHLGNTPTVALQSYIDPAVFGHWNKGFNNA